MIGIHSGPSLQLPEMLGAFDGSAVTTVLGSFLAVKTLCQNKPFLHAAVCVILPLPGDQLLQGDSEKPTT